ncbi:MAG: hypothetical protein ACPF8V_03950 [Luteibaculum sp.]
MNSFKKFLPSTALLLLIALGSCTKPESSENFPLDSVPAVETKAANLTDSTSGTSGGNVLSDGGYPVTERGICWALQVPSVENIRTIDGSGTGGFDSEFGALLLDQVYFVRAYATNEKGTGYGAADSVYTNTGVLPFIRTGKAQNIDSSSAELVGLIGYFGSEEADVYGICYSRDINPDTNDIVIEAALNGVEFRGLAEGLISETEYYARAFCYKGNEIKYGNEIAFTTSKLSCNPKADHVNYKGQSILLDSIFSNIGAGTTFSILAYRKDNIPGQREYLMAFGIDKNYGTGEYLLVEEAPTVPAEG